MLTARGVKIGGSVPQNTLSAFLSKSDAFVSHGRSGWTLAVPNSHETETAGDDSSEESPSPATFARRPDQPAEPVRKAVKPCRGVVHDKIETSCKPWSLGGLITPAQRPSIVPIPHICAS